MLFIAVLRFFQVLAPSIGASAKNVNRKSVQKRSVFPLFFCFKSPKSPRPHARSADFRWDPFLKNPRSARCRAGCTPALSKPDAPGAVKRFEGVGSGFRIRASSPEGAPREQGAASSPGGGGPEKAFPSGIGRALTERQQENASVRRETRPSAGDRAGDAREQISVRLAPLAAMGPHGAKSSRRLSR